MNERIYELIRQSAVPDDQAEDYAHDKGLIEPAEKLDVAKFAELIVKECADVLVTEMNRLDSLDRVVAAQTMDTAQVLIRKHFGVEE